MSSVEPPVYLDNHATTRVDPRVLDVMLPWFSEHYGNAASRGHAPGYRAARAVEAARAQVAKRLGCSPKEVLFTSGATESNNLAILGCVRQRGAHGAHVVTVATEHKAVLDPVHQLMREGAQVTVLPVDSEGRIESAQVDAALRPDTVLVSVMAVNNEIGVEQPVAAIGALCRERGVVFHCDAAQTAYTPLDVRSWNVDLLSLSGHKLYGPKGIGALYVRRGRPRIQLTPLVFGGGHERGMRSGTLPVPLIVGLGEAIALLGHPDEAARVAALRDHLWAGLSAIDGVVANSPEQRAPQNLNVSFLGVEAEALLMAVRGIAVSTGSACTSATLEPSHVLKALGLEQERVQSAIRFGLGRFTTRDEIDRVVERFVASVDMLRAMRVDTFLS
ncbi:MAG: cysteine desulfurase [Myxococcota bacterium]|jgi:cysteine desulfurase